jgi:DNA invertase Pin-like site-specific DNA recombinase
MSKIYAYLRGSINSIDTENQKYEILNYCNTYKITSDTPIKFIEDIASGTVEWREREIGKILDESAKEEEILKKADSRKRGQEQERIEPLKKGDLLLVTEFSRLGRTVLQVLEILKVAAAKGISIRVTKSNIIVDNTIYSTIISTVFGLAAEIEKDFISRRTIEALAKRKAEGVKLGRPKGQSELLKLDAHKEKIVEYLKKGINKRAISKLIECSPATLYKWMKRRRLK